jgi:hypothetical protein
LEAVLLGSLRAETTPMLPTIAVGATVMRLVADASQ